MATQFRAWRIWWIDSGGIDWKPVEELVFVISCVFGIGSHLEPYRWLTDLPTANRFPLIAQREQFPTRWEQDAIIVHWAKPGEYAEAHGRGKAVLGGLLQAEWHGFIPGPGHSWLLSVIHTQHRTPKEVKIFSYIFLTAGLSIMQHAFVYNRDLQTCCATEHFSLHVLFLLVKILLWSPTRVINPRPWDQESHALLTEIAWI